MALSGLLTFEVRTTGSETNSGGFVIGATGTDFTLQDGAQYSGINLASTNGTSATPGVSSASHNFVAADVGNLIFVSAGTNWTVGVYQIVSVAANIASLDRAVGSAASLSSGTFAVGGALASPGRAGEWMVAGNKAWVKSGTYSITSATANTNAGCVSLPGSGATNTCQMQGYHTSRGDIDGTRPLLQASGITTFTMMTAAASQVINIDFDGASLSGGAGGSGNAAFYYQCSFKNFPNKGVTGNVSTMLVECLVTNCGTNAVNSCCLVGCVLSGNTSTGWTGGADGLAILCIADNNTGATTDGFVPGQGGIVYGCTAYNNGRDNVRIGSSQSMVVNTLAFGTNGTSFNLTLAQAQTVYASIINCAADTYSSNVSSVNKLSSVTLSADPFTAKASKDFSLNNTAGGGASCRNAASLGVFQGGSSTGHLDIGAVQHANPTQPAANVVLTGTSYNDGATTGTLTLTTADLVLTGTTFGIGGTSVAGTLTLPVASHLLSGDVVGRGGTSVTGTLTLPTASHVLNDQTYGVGGNGSTGSLTLPTNSHVLSDQTYGIAGNGSTGTATLPTQSQVLNGITFGIAGGSTGNVTQPATTDVRTGTQYGASGTQFTGTLDVSGGTTTGNSVVMMV